MIYLLIFVSLWNFGFLQIQHHIIQVIDSHTKRGVPMVNLSTTNLIPHHTDSNGFVAFLEYGMMDQEVWFNVEAEGYEIKPWTEMFPLRGRKVVTVQGGNTTFEVDRLNVAERIYRTTGQGVYEDTFISGKEIEYPNNNQNVVGQDTVFTVAHKGLYYWFWGDTDRTSFALGNFYTTGATTPLNLDLEKHPPYKYFAEGDFVKSLTPFFQNDSHPVWVNQVVSMDDKMLTTFIKATDPKSYYGYAVWNNENEIFDFIRLIDEKKEFVIPTGLGQGQPFYNTRDSDDYYIYFGNPYINIRIPKSPASCYYKVSCYESFSPLKVNTGSWDFPDDVELDYVTEHLIEKKLRYGWKKNTGVLTPNNMADLVSSKKMKEEEAIYLQLRGIKSGEKIIANSGSVSWNEYLQKYVFVLEQMWGDTSFIGEIWVSTSDNFMGPFKYARKVVSHFHHDFYNIKEHSLFAKDKYIYFEGTYVNTFDKGINVPRYNYNNQMYRLNLDLLNLPDAVYYHKKKDKVFLKKFISERDFDELEVLFYAYSSPVDVFQVGICRSDGKNILKFTDDCTDVLFYGAKLDGSGLGKRKDEDILISVLEGVFVFKG